MKLSAELTLYPFDADFIPPIVATVDHLKAFNGLKIDTFPTATIVVGDYDVVMAAINDTMAWTYREFGRCVFITKFIPDYEAV